MRQRLIFLLLGTIIIGGLIAFYCYKSSRRNLEWEALAEQTVNDYYGKEIILPDTDSINLVIGDREQILSAPYKIITYFDADCSVCLAKLDFWKKFITEISSLGHRITVVVYVNSTYESNTKTFMAENWPKDQPWVFDRFKKFLIANRISDVRFHSLLVDADNKIILIGDPLTNPSLRMLYLETVISIQ